MLRARIQSLDGLRFFAALGVLWIHSWTSFGNPRWHIMGIDITSILAIGGNGVDLFFVISGFCMYFFYADQKSFTYQDFLLFIKKRWIRLSPAFYVATLVYLITDIIINHSGSYFLIRMLTSMFYLNSVYEQYNAAPHFWTLGVEWQFYLLVPFILIYQHKIGFKTIFCLVVGMPLVMALTLAIIFKNKVDALPDQLLFRIVEFGWGIIAAKILMFNGQYFKNRMLWLFVFVVIIYSGKMLTSKFVLQLSSLYYNIFKLAGFTVMGCGFAGIIYLSITSNGWLHRLMGYRLFMALGKMSYSFYLWHVIVYRTVAYCLTYYHLLSNDISAPLVTTGISTLLLFPVSKISYNFLEKPVLSIGNLTSK